MKPRDFFSLQSMLNNWIMVNEQHHNVENRWLAKEAEKLKRLAMALHADGPEELAVDDQKSLKKFRNDEIESAKSELMKQMRNLEHEQVKLNSNLKG